MNVRKNILTFFRKTFDKTKALVLYYRRRKIKDESNISSEGKRFITRKRNAEKTATNKLGFLKSHRATMLFEP